MGVLGVVMVFDILFIYVYNGKLFDDEYKKI